MEIRAGEGLRWTTKEIADVKQAQVMALVDEGLSVRDIAKETGMSKSAVDRIKKAAPGGGDSRPGCLRHPRHRRS